MPSSFAIFHNISTAKLVKFIWSSLLFFITSWIEIRFTLPLVPVPFQFNYWGQVNWHKLYHYFVFQMIECWFSLIIFACLLETKREMVKVWTIEGDYHVKPDRSKGNFYIFFYHCWTQLDVFIENIQIWIWNIFMSMFFSFKNFNYP